MLIQQSNPESKKDPREESKSDIQIQEVPSTKPSFFFNEDADTILGMLEDHQDEPVKQMEHVFLVGFHHLVGS